MFKNLKSIFKKNKNKTAQLCSFKVFKIFTFFVIYY